ncbi:MAG: ABC transporter permease subunit [Firmicutes bacterium]|nr:ABC transporter permease subunit [Bacillota bacterium]
MKRIMAAPPQNTHTSLGYRIKRELHKNRYVYLMIIPVALYYIIFCYGPMFGVVIAFKEFDIGRGIFESPWVGLKHFKSFLADMYFGRLIRNTVLISFYDLLFGFPAPIILALLLNEIKSLWFKRSIQTIAYLPHFISVVVICGMIADFFSADGLVTKFLVVLGGEKVNYLGDAKYFRSVFVGTNIWQGIGWNSIIYMAALSGVDAQLYEAAVIDGAGRWRQVIHITIPEIVPTIIILLILRMGQIMSVGFEKIILLYNPGTYETADVISSYVYRRGLSESFQYSYSAAVGIFQSVVNLFLLITANKVSNRLTETSLF